MSSTLVPEIKSVEFNSKTSSGVCVIKFWSEFCGPCKNYANTFNEFANDNRNVHCFSVDAINEPELATKFSVRRVPLTIVLKDGQEVNRMEGVQNVAQLERSIQ